MVVTGIIPPIITATKPDIRPIMPQMLTRIQLAVRENRFNRYSQTENHQAQLKQTYPK